VKETGLEPELVAPKLNGFDCWVAPLLLLKFTAFLSVFEPKLKDGAGGLGCGSGGGVLVVAEAGCPKLKGNDDFSSVGPVDDARAFGKFLIALPNKPPSFTLEVVSFCGWSFFVAAGGSPAFGVLFVAPKLKALFDEAPKIGVDDALGVGRPPGTGEDDGNPEFPKADLKGPDDEEPELKPEAFGGSLPVGGTGSVFSLAFEACPSDGNLLVLPNKGVPENMEAEELGGFVVPASNGDFLSACAGVWPKLKDGTGVWDVKPGCGRSPDVLLSLSALED